MRKNHNHVCWICKYWYPVLKVVYIKKRKREVCLDCFNKKKLYKNVKKPYKAKDYGESLDDIENDILTNFW